MEIYKDILVSVVVPVYKVEQDIRKCVYSIQNQTHERLEIILVDDGSPDNCPQICDDFAENDPRIEVIHKENGGLSDARNVALDICKGDYILFVDSDDMIHSEMIESLLNLCITNGAEIAVCNYISVSSNNFRYNEIASRVKLNADYEILSPSQALIYMMDVYKKFQVSAWNKLYKATLLKKVRYPKGIYYEDIATTYKLIDQCNKIAYSHNEYYFYQLRKNSITHSGFNKRDLDKIRNCTDLLEFVNKHYPEARNAAYVYKYVYCYMTIADKLISSTDADASAILKDLRKEAKNSKKKIITSSVPMKKKVSFFLFIHWLSLYKIVVHIKGDN